MTKPVLFSPLDGSTNVATGPRLYTKNVSGGTEYVFQLAENSSFTNAATKVESSGSSLTSVFFEKLKLNTTYYWRVKVRKSTDSSTWSDAWSFTTLSSIQLYTPTANGQTWTPRLNASTFKVFGYDTFEFQMDSISSFNSSHKKTLILPDTGSNPWVDDYFVNLLFGQKYFCRVRGLKPSGNSPWSDTIYGTVYDSLRPQSPSPFSSSNGVNVEFKWLGDISAATVQIQLDTTPHFNSPVLLDSTDNFNKTEYLTIRQLMFDTKYYWRIRSVHSDDTSLWATSYFTVDGLKNRFISISRTSPTQPVYVPLALKNVLGYHFQVDTAIDFSSINKKDFYTDTTFVLLEKLDYGQTYFIRCRPFHAKDTGEWSRTATDKIVSSVTQYYPFLSTKEVQVKDSLTWSGPVLGSEFFQIQLSEKADFSELFSDTVLDSTQTKYWPPTLKFNQTYYWRMRMWHLYDTSDWSKNGLGQSFTTVSKPTLFRPFNSNFLGADAETDLIWNPIKFVSKYEVWLDSSANFNSPVLEKYIVDSITQKTVRDLYFGQIYNWKVRAITETDTSDWSDTWVFKVLNPVRLNWPRNNSTNISLISLDWNSIKGTTGYILHLDTSSGFTNPSVFADTGTNDFFHYFIGEAPVQYNTKYYWRGKVYHSKDTTDWSEVWNFTTRPIQASKLIYPDSNSSNIPLGINFEWSAYSGAASYILQFSESPDFSSPKQYTTAGTKQTVALKPKTTYYWHIKSKNSSGQEIGDWSYTWSFNTKDTMDIPVLVSPSNNLQNATVNISLSWQAMPAVSFDVQLDDDPNFGSPIERSSTGNSTTFTNLKGYTTFYWRVRAKSSFATGNWCKAWSFTTGKNAAISDVNVGAFTLYPNPTTEVLIISTNDKAHPISGIEIYDMLEQKVFSNDFLSPENEYTVDISHLASGKYFVKIIAENSVIYSPILVVR